MNTQVAEFLRWASHLSAVLPFVVFLPRLQKSPIQNRIIGSLIILSLSTDTLSFYINSPILGNSFEILQFFLASWFFYELVYKKKSEFIALIGIGVYISVLIFSILKYGFDVYYLVLWTTGATITFIHTIVYVFNVPRMVIERYFDTNLLSNMIFNASMFIYFFASLIVFFLADSSSKDQNTLQTFWSIHNAFNVLKNTGFALAFYYTGKRKIYMTFDQLEKIAQKLKQEEGDL
jgi:hypothetical protein